MTNRKRGVKSSVKKDKNIYNYIVAASVIVIAVIFLASYSSMTGRFVQEFSGSSATQYFDVAKKGNLSGFVYSAKQEPSNQFNNLLVYNYYDGVWKTENITLFSGGNSLTADFMFMSLAYDSDGMPALSVLDNHQGNLYYVWKDKTTGQWNYDFIDKVFNGANCYSELKFFEGVPYIAYHNDFTNKPVFAYKGDNGWHYTNLTAKKRGISTGTNNYISFDISSDRKVFIGYYDSKKKDLYMSILRLDDELKAVKVVKKQNDIYLTSAKKHIKIVKEKLTKKCRRDANNRCMKDENRKTIYDTISTPLYVKAGASSDVGKFINVETIGTWGYFVYYLGTSKYPNDNIVVLATNTLPKLKGGQTQNGYRIDMYNIQGSWKTSRKNIYGIDADSSGDSLKVSYLTYYPVPFVEGSEKHEGYDYSILNRNSISDVSGQWESGFSRTESISAGTGLVGSFDNTFLTHLSMDYDNGLFSCFRNKSSSNSEQIVCSYSDSSPIIVSQSEGGQAYKSGIDTISLACSATDDFGIDSVRIVVKNSAGEIAAEKTEAVSFAKSVNASFDYISEIPGEYTWYCEANDTKRGILSQEIPFSVYVYNALESSWIAPESDVEEFVLSGNDYTNTLSLNLSCVAGSCSNALVYLNMSYESFENQTLVFNPILNLNEQIFNLFGVNHTISFSSVLTNCSIGFSLCNGNCYDLDSDKLHCGSCASDCKDADVCERGACTTPMTECSPGLNLCGGKCFNLTSDKLHCGSCTNDCKDNDICENGVCVSNPSGGELAEENYLIKFIIDGNEIDFFTVNENGINFSNLSGYLFDSSGAVVSGKTISQLIAEGNPVANGDYFYLKPTYLMPAAGAAWIELHKSSINHQIVGSNPIECGNLIEGQDCLVSWTLTSNITMDKKYSFFVYGKSDETNTTSGQRVFNLLFKTDNIPPVVQILSPENKTYYTNESILLNKNITEENGIKNITYSLDGSGAEVEIGVDDTVNFSALDLSLGGHSLMLRVTDNYDNVGVAEVAFNIEYAPYVILEENFNISSCRNLTRANSVYTLINDVPYIEGANGRYCVNILADNVVLDCGGHKIYALERIEDGSGIVTNSVKNVVIKNCNIKNFNTAIYLLNTDSSNISLNLLDNNTGGVYFSNYSEMNILQNNIISNNLYGFLYSNSSTNQLISNTLWNNSVAGIYLMDSYSKHNVLYNNNFNNTINILFGEIYTYNLYNTSLISGINIIGGINLGGNYWANPSGTGFSQTCSDANSNGICDSAYVINPNNTDHFPLTSVITIILSCGDGSCNSAGGETCSSCFVDCGSCPSIETCGDGTCNATIGENCSTCSADCGVCIIPQTCGDGTCNSTETCTSCSSDCGSCSGGEIVNISSCRELNQANSIYNLVQGIGNETECINVSANNITINCNNYRILGNRSDSLSKGIIIKNVNKTVVKNCFIFNFSYGITLENSDAQIYNNLFRNNINLHTDNSTNRLNRTLVSGANLIGGINLGGNYWDNYSYTGFSKTCSDANHNGICDSAYVINVNNTDYLPLTSITPYCGDSSCNGVETCSSCSTDCGDCSGSGGGTGGGSSTDGSLIGHTIYTLTEAQLAAGYTNNLAVNDSYRFVINGVTYTARLKSFLSTNARITLAITGFPEVLILLGQTKDLDLNSDGTYDITLKFESQAAGKARIFIKKISSSVSGTPLQPITPTPGIPPSEDTISDDVSDEEGLSTGYVILIIAVIFIVLAAVFVGVYFWMKNKNKAVPDKIANTK